MGDHHKAWTGEYHRAWVSDLQALDGQKPLGPSTACDLCEVALKEAIHALGPASGYNVYFHPDNPYEAQHLYAMQGCAMHESKVGVAFINFIPDETLRNYDAWRVEANGLRWVSDGA